MDEIVNLKIINCVLSFVKDGEKLEQCTARLPLDPEAHALFDNFKKHVKSFTGLQEMCDRIGIKNFGMKILRYNRDTTRNFVVVTQSQWQLELQDFVNNPTSNELNVQVIEKKIEWKTIFQKEWKPGPTNTTSSASPKPIPSGRRKRKTKREKTEDKTFKKNCLVGTESRRNERQEKELSDLNMKLGFLSGSRAISEDLIVCGICSEKKRISGDRGNDGRVRQFQLNHYDKCFGRKLAKEHSVQGCKKLSSFFSQVSQETEEPKEDDILLEENFDNENYDDNLIESNLLCEPEQEEIQQPCDLQCDDFSSDEPEEISAPITDSESVDSLEATDIFPLFMESAHPIAERLNTLLQEKKIAEESILYKYLDNVTEFATTGSNMSNFRWDRNVVEFFETIQYLGGKRTYNFVRGPGWLNTGRGGQKDFDSFKDFNLCGPSENAVRNSKAGYTTASGVIKPLLQTFYSYTSHPKCFSKALLSNDKVHIMPCSVASDATALKPGLEVDVRQGELVGATVKIDKRFIDEHQNDPPSFMKDKFVTEANVTFATTVDGGISLPIAVHYLPKSMNGEQMRELYETTVITIQCCSSCVDSSTTENQILTKRTVEELCNSVCNDCLRENTICDACLLLGHTSHHPALRACARCMASNNKCFKNIVLAVVTDCEEKNKKVMEFYNGPGHRRPEIELLSMIPDAVHLGKSLKCSWSNWFLVSKDQRTNLVFLRTLRDHGDMKTKTSLRKYLTLECVRNKDRMAVEPIRKLSRQNVQHVLESIKCVVHTLVPETYKYWKSNVPGMYKVLTSICMSTEGKMLVLEKDPGSSFGRLLEVRLHYPCDVKVLKKDIPDPGDMTFSEGVAYISEHTAGLISFFDISGNVQLKVSSLRTRNNIEMELQKRNLSCEGNVADLRKRLSSYLVDAKDSTVPGVLQLDRKLNQPWCLTVNDEHLFCAEEGRHQILQMSLSFTGVTVVGTILKLIKFPTHTQSVFSMCQVTNGCLITSCKGVNEGIFSIDVTSEESVLLKEIDGVSGVSRYSAHQIVFGDMNTRQVKELNIDTGSTTVIAGTGERGSCDGTEITAKFVQPYELCTEGKTIFVTDSGSSQLKIITGLDGTIPILQSMATLYDAFGICSQHGQDKPDSIQEIELGVARAKDLLDSHVEQAKEMQSIPQSRTTNGPSGTISKKTQDSFSILDSGLKKINMHLTDNSVDPHSFLTTNVENLHAVSHFRNTTFSVLQYARDFGTIMKESVKRTSSWAAKYYTHRDSYYPVPESSLKLNSLPFLSQVPANLQAASCIPQLRQWGEIYKPMRQRTVRDETTKDKCGTLPVHVYATNNDKNEEIALSFSPNSDSVDEVNEQSDEYDTDSDSEQESIPDVQEAAQITTRSGRLVRAALRLDL